MALRLTALLLLAHTIAIGILVPSPVRSESVGEREALLGFISAVPHEQRVRWDANSSACIWVGITCDANRSAVLTLRLPGIGLLGAIPAGTLGHLSSLRVISLRSNRLSGPIPDDFAGLTLLRSLYLQHNLFSGEIPSGLSQLNRLLRLDLSANNLTGEIPFALSNLTHLKRFFLQENRLSGSLPSISIDSLVEFNVSNNRLNGSIPRALQRFSASSFVGNLYLCGSPLPPCNPFFPSPAPSPAGEAKSKRNLSTAAIVGIAVGAGVALLLLLLLVVLIGCTTHRRRQRGPSGKAGAAATTEVAGKSGETATSSSKDDIRGGAGSSGALAAAAERNRLVFVGKGGGYSFDLEDLLRASAEVLGKGSVGTSYKAVLEEGTTVVVKRLKDVTASKREFEGHMEALGQIEPVDNLLPLRAYYYSKDEKLLVFDYLPAGSLSSLLHGSRGSGRTPLDWESRTRVALAAGRGLSHLHTAAQIVHGNVKASNVLLRSNFNSAALSDFGLHPMFGSSAPANRVAGYRAPEVLETRKHTFKSDVYSFGVLLLELLTGKAPNQASLSEDGIDLPRWVQSVVREEWTAEVFDVELMRYPNIEEEMVLLLQVAMACVSTVPDNRPDISEVVCMMEELVNRTEATGADRQAGGSAALPPPPAGTP